MIVRIWRGRTPVELADEYLEYVKETGLKQYRQTPGNRAASILLRKKDEEGEFLVVSLWESLDAIKNFAGDDYEHAVYYPEDEKYLIELEPHVTHYELACSEGSWTS